jgi:hypothetical protein
MAQMTLDVAQHEVSHLLGAAIAYMGDRHPQMKFFPGHTRYFDASVYFGYDEEAQRGEFALVVSKFMRHDVDLDDGQIDLIRRSSSLAPIGLCKDGNRIFHVTRQAKHMHEFLAEFTDVLSPEDRRLAVKGTPLITHPDQLVGAFAWPSARKVAPDRTDGIVDVIKRHGGIGGTLPLKEFVPRRLAADILKEARSMATSCFALARA